MSDCEVLTIFHFGRNFIWDNESSVCNGANMVFLSKSITYSQLVKKYRDFTILDINGHNPIIQYLHHNGKVCTFVRIKNDEDVTSCSEHLRGCQCIVLVHPDELGQ